MSDFAEKDFNEFENELRAAGIFLLNRKAIKELISGRLNYDSLVGYKDNGYRGYDYWEWGQIGGGIFEDEVGFRLYISPTEKNKIRFFQGLKKEISKCVRFNKGKEKRKIKGQKYLEGVSLKMSKQGERKDKIVVYLPDCDKENMGMNNKEMLEIIKNAVRKLKKKNSKYFTEMDSIPAWEIYGNLDASFTELGIYLAPEPNAPMYCGRVSYTEVLLNCLKSSIDENGLILENLYYNLYFNGMLMRKDSKGIIHRIDPPSPLERTEKSFCAMVVRFISEKQKTDDEMEI